MKVVLFTLSLIVALCLRNGCAAEAALMPGPSDIPAWLEQGRFHFARLDGGPVEILKTRRSSWGKHFSERELEVLGNLYTKYDDRMLDLLQKAGVNFIWLTWSVGYSWEDEAEQRKQCTRLIQKLHGSGIRVGAYLCAVSMFWESLFRDEPSSLTWVKFAQNGLPFRYGGGYDAFRFIADISNRNWIELQERRVGAAADAGFDAIFFDNTSASGFYNDDASMERFITAMRQHIRDDKRARLAFFSNFGPVPSRALMNRYMELGFAEGSKEPGIWDGEWQVDNIRVIKVLRGIIPEWKPLTTEYSEFHDGNRNTTFMSPRSQKLATAEAAAFRADYSWNMEGPFYAALVSSDPRAMASWEAIGTYRRFLREHQDLYWKAHTVSPIAVLTHNVGRAFLGDKQDAELFALLIRNSVLFDIRLPVAIGLDELMAYKAAILLPPPSVQTRWSSISMTADRISAQKTMLEQYGKLGGQLYAPDWGVRPQDMLARLRTQAPEAFCLSISGATNVLGTITKVHSQKDLAIHLLNYNPQPVTGLRVRLRLDGDLKRFRTAKVRLITPDADTEGLEIEGTDALDLHLNTLNIYAVVVLETSH